MAKEERKRSPNRTATASFLVRCSGEQKAQIERAVASISASLPGGATMTVQGFVLDAALRRARDVLGKR